MLFLYLHLHLPSLLIPAPPSQHSQHSSQARLRYQSRLLISNIIVLIVINIPSSIPIILSILTIFTIILPSSSRLSGHGSVYYPGQRHPDMLPGDEAL